MLTPRHRGQLLNYLILADAAHGKLINFRTDRVQHEFVNNNLSHAAERTSVFIIETSAGGRWKPGASRSGYCIESV